MRATREVETKLSVPDGFAMPDLSAVADRVEVRTLRLRATYFDSADLRLARSGTTLRHRTGEGRPQWTLKLGTATTAGLDREELTVLGARTSVPPALQDLLTAPLRGAGLQEVVQLRTRRTSMSLLDAEGRAIAEVVDDHVDVLRDGVVTQSWRELEVEQREGPVAAVLSALRAAGTEVGDQTPKAVRALGPLPAPDLPSVHRVRRKDPVGDLVRRCLAAGIHGLVAHDIGVRRGQDDEVHQMRVSCRRLRSDLRTFRGLLDDPRVERLREELQWLASSFGAARDLEVLRERLRRAAAQDPLQVLDASAVDVLLAAEEQHAVALALEALRSPRYLLLLQVLHDLASDPVLSAKASVACEVLLPELVDRAWKQAAKPAGRLRRDAADADWHRARILAKRARYAAEAAEVALGKAMRPTAAAAKALQERLGEHQDAAVAATRVLALADDHPELAVLCGRLAERERARLRQVREEHLRTWKQVRRT